MELRIGRLGATCASDPRYFSSCGFVLGPILTRVDEILQARGLILLKLTGLLLAAGSHVVQAGTRPGLLSDRRPPQSLDATQTALLSSPDAHPGKKTMTREEDAVVIRGRDVMKNRGQRIDRLALLAKAQGRIQPIPFQVDEINADGEWVLPDVPPYLKVKSSPVEQDEDRGALDENDELVFMLRDSGDPMSGAEFPPLAQAVDEIMLSDPVGGGRSWVYLCSFLAGPPLSDRDYVSYLFPQNRVVSDDYELGFSLEVPFSWDYISFRGAPNMIDRMKIRIGLKILGIPYSRNETHFKSDLSSYKDGPVRVIRRVRSSFRLNRLLKTPSTASESIYYQNAVVVPFRVTVPVSLKTVRGMVSDLSIRGGVDMQNMHGWQLLAEASDARLAIDGRMDEKEKSLQGIGASWFLLSGPTGAFLCRMVLNRNWDGSLQQLPLSTSFFYVDDDGSPDPPEFVPGQSPNVGFFIHGAENLSRGTHYYYIVNYMIRGYRQGEERAFLDILDRPVEAKVDAEAQLVHSRDSPELLPP